MQDDYQQHLRAEIELLKLLDAPGVRKLETNLRRGLVTQTMRDMAFMKTCGLIKPPHVLLAEKRLSHYKEHPAEASDPEASYVRLKAKLLSSGKILSNADMFDVLWAQSEAPFQELVAAFDASYAELRQTARDQAGASA